MKIQLEIMRSIKKIYHFAYAMIPFKGIIFNYLRGKFTISERIYKHLYFKGYFKVFLDSEKFFWLRHNGSRFENDIFWRGLAGAWEKSTINIWIELSKSSNTVFDIGSNTGVFSLASCTVNPGVSVYAFEPLERMQKILKLNISKNKYKIEPFKLAVSDSNKVATIYDQPFDIFRQATLNSTRFESELVSETTVECISLDSFVQLNNIESVDLIKIDVETHEFEVLKGFKEGLGDFKPILIIEILNNELFVKISGLLKNLDYNIYQIDEIKGLITTENLFDQSNRNYCCIHRPKLKSILNKIGVYIAK